MSALQEQLAVLRKRIARIDRKYARGDVKPQAAPTSDNPSRYFVEEWLSGQEVETPFGRHFETEKLYESHRRHGSMDIGSLAELDPRILSVISGGAIPDVPPADWAFLDTETTGLAGGTGTCAFLIGVGRITPEGFRVRQFFMRDHGEEASMLAGLSAHLSEFRVLITYNGRVYDQPLLETRYRLARQHPPFAALEHLDLLFGARRLWRLRFESCRLVDLENQVLGVERQGDLPGELIPYVYFEYLRTREAFRLVPILHHNAIDILTLACLAGIVPAVFQDPACRTVRHGAEMVGMARWLRAAGQPEEALSMLRRGVDSGLSDDLLFRTLWDIALLERKLGHDSAAIAVWSELAATRNPFRARAIEELAKYYEHREKNPAMALDLTRQAMALEETPELRRRESRLRRRVAANGSKSGKIF